MFEQYREGVAERAAALAELDVDEEEGQGADDEIEEEEGDDKRKAKKGVKKRRHSASGAAPGGDPGGAGDSSHHHPVDDVLRELGLGEFALDGGGGGANSKRSKNADFGLGGLSGGDGREEEGSRFLRLLRQAACPGAMLQG